MLTKLSEKIVSFTSGFRVILAAIVFMGFGKTMGLLEDRIKEVSGGIGVPDLQFLGYDAEHLYAMLYGYGEVGRGRYFTGMLVDMVYPWVYATFFALLISWLNKKAFGEKNGWVWCNLIPTAALALDYIENLCLYEVMQNYPTRLDALANFAGHVTQAKWACAALSLLVIFASFLSLVITGGRPATNHAKRA